MKASRDRERRRAGKESRPEKVSDADFARRVSEFCRRAHQENTELIALLQQQRQALLAYLGRKGTIQ